MTAPMQNWPPSRERRQELERYVAAAKEAYAETMAEVQEMDFVKEGGNPFRVVDHHGSPFLGPLLRTVVEAEQLLVSYLNGGRR